MRRGRCILAVRPEVVLARVWQESERIATMGREGSSEAPGRDNSDSSALATLEAPSASQSPETLWAVQRALFFAGSREGERLMRLIW